MKITVKRKCFANSDNIKDNQSKGYNLELGPGDVIVSNLTGARFKILKPKDGYAMVRNLDNGIISHISNDSLNSEIFHLGSLDDEINAADELDSEEYKIDHPEQEFDSAETSINSNKLPAVYRMISIPEGTIGVDFGGGKFDNGVEHIRDLGATLCVYDPYNRSAEHNREVIKTLKENGGAYDIDPAQYFTRDDLDEFAQDVVDAINGEGYSKVELISSFIDDGKVEITLDWDGDEVSSAIKIDMRRIRRPSDIQKYIQPMCAALLGKLAPIGFDFGPHFNGEDYPLRGSTDVMSYVELDPEERESPKARPDEERVITIDGYQADLAVADDGSYVIANDNLIDHADDIADVNDLVLSGGRHLKVWSDRTYQTELFDSTDIVDAISDVIADDVPEDPGKYKLDCDVELTYAITDIATFDIDDPNRFDFDHIKSNLKRAEVFNVKISPIE